MSNPAWVNQMNTEYSAAKTDEERMAALQKHMGHDQALRAMESMGSGATSSCHETKRTSQRKRPPKR